MSETTTARDAGIESGWSLDGAEAPADGEFVRQLHQGSDHLAAGDVPAALAALEQAVALRPKDAKAQGLLALCYFKLGRLEEAAQTYLALVRDNPFDVTLHVNLGLVQLKAGRLEEAIRTLEIATGLAPEHRKAQNYLGLAFAQSGDYQRAREAFLRAGSAAKAAEMDQALAMTARAAPEAAAKDIHRTPTEPFLRVPDPDAESERRTRVAIHSSAPDEIPPSLAETVRSNRLHWPRGSPFAIDSSGVSVDFAGRIQTRIDGLVVARGDTAWAPLRKRFGGRTIDRPFGPPSRQLWQASGGGQLFLSSRVEGVERAFAAMRLEEDAYVVEEHLFAFEEAVDAENGRVPGRDQDLALVRLRGRGYVLLATPRPIKSEQVFGNESVRVPKQGLVGWTGPLTPRLLAMHEGPDGVWVELTGEGDVLLLA